MASSRGIHVGTYSSPIPCMEYLPTFTIHLGHISRSKKLLFPVPYMNGAWVRPPNKALSKDYEGTMAVKNWFITLQKRLY